MPTDKQMGMISYLLRGQSGKVLIEKMPRNNAKYPDVSADYKEAILSDFIRENFSISEASILIKKLSDYKYLEAETLLKNKGLKI